jgi:NAD(P)-dependent dehydrogenase (short-subunit alcohol dehydrogenase family)
VTSAFAVKRAASVMREDWRPVLQLEAEAAMTQWTLTHKIILITGGARGIGAATAAELARRGALPVLADLDADALAATAAGLSPAPMTLELDFTDAEACEAAVAEVLERHGRLDAVWANAGIATIGPVALTDPRAWARTVQVNLLGAYYTVRAALPSVISARGYVAVTSSLAAFGHAPQMSAYCATKAGVEAMCDSLRAEVAHHGVDVASIHPGWIDTDMVREGDESMRSFQVLRASMAPPLNKTYPVSRAARDIARGFARRRPRICTPWYVQAGHALRPLLNTRLLARDQFRVAPEMEEAFRAQSSAQGSAGASMSARVSELLAGR